MHIPCVLENSPLEQSNLQSQLISEHNFMPCLEKGKKKKGDTFWINLTKQENCIFAVVLTSPNYTLLLREHENSQLKLIFCFR